MNVLELALRRQGLELQWHDLRDSTFERLNLDGCFGIIVNVRVSGWLGGWLAAWALK